MSSDVSLHQRRRPLTTLELDTIPWLDRLSPAEYERTVEDLKITDAVSGEYVCRTGRPVTYWFGVVDG
ncbi:MAG TPA: Crp/Fnr family transcriptional regulator, partial [Rhodoferax sp.]